MNNKVWIFIWWDQRSGNSSKAEHKKVENYWDQQKRSNENPTKFLVLVEDKKRDSGIEKQS